MKILITKYAEKKYNKYRKSDSKLSQKLDVTILRLGNNPNHPSLRLHKLSGRLEEWSVSVTSDIRLIFQYVDSGILVVDLGTHDEVY